MKKLVMLLLAVVLVFSLAIIATAAEAEAMLSTTKNNLPQLGSVTDLTWGVQHGWAWDAEDKAYHDPSLDTKLPGVASFKRAAPEQGRYETLLYKVGEEDPIAGYEFDVDDHPYSIDWVEEYFINCINESGDYYFTVTALGDGVEYADGPTVRSEIWTYTRPVKQLTAPTQLSWDWPNARFNIAEGLDKVSGCYVEFYHTPVLGQEPSPVDSTACFYITNWVNAYDEMIQRVGNGYYSFKVMILSRDITATANSEMSAMSPVYHISTVEDDSNEFKDVPNDAYYRDAVVWAVENGITTGTGDGTTFEPNTDCTRGQVVTFLWRAAGEPEPTVTENPFVDVKAGDYFYKAVLWAKENGITTGTSATTFAPNEICNRAQIVTFLSRAKNGQPTKDENPFTDVAENAFYYNPVLWAVQNGITTGTGDGSTFEPNNPCTRGQVITFLWRAYTK